jgi:hypothetical protein
MPGPLLKKSVKSILLLLIVGTSVMSSFGQSIPSSTIEDKVLGWMKVYNFTGTKKPLQVDAKLYSVNQLSICDTLANWMQASYLPKGGLGDVRRTVLEKLGQYNQNKAALPPSYGAVAKVYMFLKYDKGKMVPENNLGLSWSIMANRVPGWEVSDISSPTQYYFTLPSFDAESGYETAKKIHDLSTNSNINPYISFWVKNIEAGGGTDYVLLCKDNRSPFIQLKKGEYLSLLEQAIPRIHEIEKKKLYEKEQGNQSRAEPFVKILEEKKQVRLANLEKIKEKYKDRLNEIALVNAQPSLTDLDTKRDVFSNGYITDPESTSRRMPVYKVDPVMAELCKKDQPQWILVSWWWSPNQPVEKHLHESIVNNFNFGYLYNFFFAPEKVKGQPYRPLRSPTYEEPVVIAEESEQSKKIKGDKTVFFFEDFSRTAIGKKPNGWNSRLNAQGNPCLVTMLDGETGHWAELKGNEAFVPTGLKGPFPQNFTISYDVIVPQNFTWGGKGLELRLSNEKSFLMVRARPGFGGREGEVEIEAKFPTPPGYMNSTKWVPAPGFSNNKKNNRITVTIKKREEDLQFFIDQNKITEYSKAIPAGLLFTTLSFTHGRSDKETEKFFISNIKITKE